MAGSVDSWEGDVFSRNPNLVDVGVGELAVARHPEYLMTPALGSCVGVALYDSTLRQGGMAHVMLPARPERSNSAPAGRFAAEAIAELVGMLKQVGSPRRRLVAKIAGGAAMFGADMMLPNVGERNVLEVKRQLELLKVPLLAEDTGEGHARTIELHLDTGILVVRSYMFGVRKL